MTRFASTLRTSALIAPALFAAGTAQAQVQDVPTKSIQWSASSRLEHESNVYKANDALGVPGTTSRSEQTLTLETRLDIVYPVGRNALFLNSSFGYEFHRRNENLDRERIRVVGGGELNILGSCKTRLSADYARQQSDLADIVISGTPGSVVNVEERWGGTADIRCGNIIGLTPGFRYRHEETNNSATLRKVSNVVYDDFTVSLGYTRPSIGIISVYGNYRDGRYPDRDTTTTGLPFNDGIKVYGAGLRFERNIGSRLIGSVSAGYQHVDPKSTGTASFSGLSYSGDITWTATDRLQSRIALGRSAEQSNLFLTSYAVRTFISWDTNFKVNERFDINGAFSYAKRNYRVSTVDPGQIARDADKTWLVRGGAGYRFARLFRLGLDATHEWRRSNTTLARYKDTRVALTLGVTL